MKKCPFCQGDIQEQAVFCKHCNKWIEINEKSNPEKKPSRKKWLIGCLVIPLVLISVFSVLFIFSSLTNEEDPTDDEYVILDPNPTILIHTVANQQTISSSQIINTANVEGIVKLQRLGMGKVYAWEVSSDETTVVFGTSLGLNFYDLQTQTRTR